MSEAKWCDHGNHPYSALESGTQTITITQNTTDVYGRPSQTHLSKDICGKCAQSIKLLALSGPDESDQVKE